LSAPVSDLFTCIPKKIDLKIEVHPLVEFSGTVYLSIEKCPAEINWVFDSNPVIPPGSSTLTLSVTESAKPGTYPFIIKGNSEEIHRTLPLSFHVVGAVPHPPDLLSPPDCTKKAGYTNLEFIWSPVSEATDYHLKIAEDPNITSIIADLNSLKSSRYLFNDFLTILHY